MSAGLRVFGRSTLPLLTVKDPPAGFATFHAEQRRVDVVAGHEFLSLGQRDLGFVLGGSA